MIARDEAFLYKSVTGYQFRFHTVGTGLRHGEVFRFGGCGNTVTVHV